MSDWLSTQNYSEILMVSVNVNIFSSFGRANKLKNELITSLNSKVKLVAKVGIQEPVRLGGHG